ncbi:MAG TPA: hypothetical protein DHW02_15665 [Ktedonobacter sp.]|nr:hypothetical protein [Ktedonobacter sp.]
MPTLTSESLFKVRLFLEEGRSQDALAILQKTQPQEEEASYDVAYLRGWCFILNRRWDDAREALSPLLQEAYKEDPTQEPLPDRERLIMYLLRLGQVAAMLAHYDDARVHFALCLKMLHDRRIFLPLVRIRAHAFLAMTYLMKGLCSLALHHYEEALRLSEHYNEESELANIYYGLCATRQSLGDFIGAYEAGREALRIYLDERDELLQIRMYNLLASISAQLTDVEVADDYYAQSLRLAEERDRPVMIMLNYTGLAELRLQQKRLEEVTTYINKALAYARQVDDKNMAGSVYISIAKVVLAMAEETHEASPETAYARAIELFQEAEECLKDTQSYVALAELYGRWGEVLERTGQFRESINCWQSAYLMMKKTKVVEH